MMPLKTPSGPWVRVSVRPAPMAPISRKDPVSAVMPVTAEIAETSRRTSLPMLVVLTVGCELTATNLTPGMVASDCRSSLPVPVISEPRERALAILTRKVAPAETLAVSIGMPLPARLSVRVRMPCSTLKSGVFAVRLTEPRMASPRPTLTTVPVPAAAPIPEILLLKVTTAPAVGALKATSAPVPTSMVAPR